ncbi:MAG: MASE1 domain-containing protein [bacterium]|nr:MASE1 domain-containing protein [bacterium]
MRQTRSRQYASIWRLSLWNALLVILYVGTAKLGLLFAVVQGNATLIWMPTGLSLAAVLLGGYALLPGVAAGAFLTVATSPVPVWVAFSASLGNTLEAFLGAFLLKHVAQFDPSLRRLRDVWSLFLWAALLSTIASATIGVGSLCLAGAAGWATFPKVWLTWWLGNVMGNLLAAPLLLVWSRLPRWQMSYLLEFILMLAATCVVTLAAFGGWIPSTQMETPYPLVFTVFPLLIWASLRFEQYGATAANFVAAGCSVWMTVIGRGPFASFGLQESIALLWVFLAVTTVSALVLAASVSERRQAEEALQHAYAQVHQFINNAPGVAIQGYDLDGRVLFWNKASEDLYGFTEQQALGKRLGDFLLSQEDAREFEQMLTRIAQTGHPAPLREWETKTTSGAPRYIISSLFPVRLGDGRVQIVCMDVDITERKRLEAELLRAQRLDSIGRLAGGIAHDFNNLLTAIMSYADIALARLPEGHPAAEDVQRILDAANRAAELVRHLLAFARRQTLTPQIIDLNHLIHNLTPLLNRLVGKQVELRIITDPALKTVKADPVQIEQIILNLAINARDAMPTSGVLTIKTENVVLDATAVQSMPGVPAGEYVTLSVSDTGTGIAPEHLEHIFEPFFTTKGERGTGLGLAVVYGVVKQSGGHIMVQSAPGQGTTFRIYLPSISSDSERSAA